MGHPRLQVMEELLTLQSMLLLLITLQLLLNLLPQLKVPPFVLPVNLLHLPLLLFLLLLSLLLLPSESLLFGLLAWTALRLLFPQLALGSVSLLDSPCSSSLPFDFLLGSELQIRQ